MRRRHADVLPARRWPSCLKPDCSDAEIRVGGESIQAPGAGTNQKGRHLYRPYRGDMLVRLFKPRWRARRNPDSRKDGGDGGIRTLDRALQPYNGLANRRLQPLGHISGKADMPDAGATRKRRFAADECSRQ
jgi:hypothetical protein